MKIEKFNKLKQLTEMRELVASNNLQVARRVLKETKDALKAAKQMYFEKQKSGEAAIKNFFSDMKPSGDYTSRLSHLRTLAARFDNEIQEAKALIETSEQAIREADQQLLLRLDEYRQAHQKMEKMKNLEKKFIEEQQLSLAIVQEADSLDNGNANKEEMLVS